MIILYHELPTLTSNSLLLSSRQIPDFRWVYYIALSKINQGIALYIINSAGIAYHQCEALYIINTKCCISSSRRKMHADAWWNTTTAEPLLVIYTALRAVMIYQACAWIKKYTLFRVCIFWAHSTKMQLKYLVEFWLRQSDVMHRTVMLLASVAVM